MWRGRLVWRGFGADWVQQHYRYWVIWRCPSVRFLDYAKVKDAERERGRELFGTETEPTPLAEQVWSPSLVLSWRCKSLTPLASQIKGQKSKAIDISSKQTSAPSKLSRIKLTDAEKKKLQERIRNATSLQEIIALEKELNEGRLPSGVQGDAMEE
jgi:U2 small nuclear ribonucleoprotein A'